MAFERKFNLIDELNAEPLFRDYLLPDIRKGDVFPAIRKNEIHFYYQGGRLFKYNGKFYTHIKYAFNSEKDLTDITEADLKELKPIEHFVDGYEKIKACCKIYSAKSEACNVAKLFNNYSYAKRESTEDKILLDIEAALDSESEEKNIDRFDLVLFDTKEETLQIVEAKLFSNNEIRAKSNNIPKVVEQIKRYEENIKNPKNENEIINAYKDYVGIVNDLFGLKLPKPAIINKNVNLLIFDFDDKQKAKLEKEVKIIKECLNNDELVHKVYIRGNVGTDKDKTILKQLFKDRVQ